MEHGKFHSPEGLRELGLGHLREAAMLLQHSATAEERDDYRRFVLTVATKVAEAHREGGQSISPAEQQAIQDITTALAG
jgi:outer membrane receptor for ferric coprogen and ferric-rhodotorulic acid